jgi:hypothetical protein
LDYLFETTKKKIYANEQKILLQNKLHTFIEGLGRDFQEFLRLNNINNNIITEILEKCLTPLGDHDHMIQYPNGIVETQIHADPDKPAGPL